MSDPVVEADPTVDPQSGRGRVALPEVLTRRRLIVALPRITGDDTASDRLKVVLEVLAQKGMPVIAVDQRDLGLLAELRGLYGTRLTFGVHGPITLDELEPVLAAEPAFVLANAGDHALVERGERAGVCVLPAGLTPNELLAIDGRGPAAVQIFPADVLGGAYGASLKLVSDELVVVPRGGLGAWAVDRWFEAGAVCCVVDESLLGDALDEGGNIGQLRERAVSFLDTVNR